MLLFICLLLARYVVCHMVMDTPLPYNFGAGLTNGPMASSAFPCTKGDTNVISNSSMPLQPTIWRYPNPQVLHLTGSVVHGGGSCRVALNYAAPGSASFDDPASWTTIYDMPSGCPVSGIAGNFEEGGTGPGDYPDAPGHHCTQIGEEGCIRFYEVPFNASLANGKATLAWIWSAKTTGETYMNCAPMVLENSPELGLLHQSSVRSALTSTTQVAPSSAASQAKVVSTGSVAAACADSGNCAVDGAAMCNGTVWWLCADGCWSDMRALGGIACINGVPQPFAG